MDWTDIALRLAAATVIGMVLGLNRDLHGKPTGMRTLGLVGLGAALAVMAVIDPTVGRGDGLNAVSRVVQGILTGIGFLGAGVIVRGSGDARVRGLTTAACIWVTASLGAACAVAAWPVIAIAVPLFFFVLVAGGPIEKALRARFGRPVENGTDSSERPPA
ncbi:MgtC/SapB family protein [Rhodoplanes sp. TEM]|uniref:Protein MgtC n=1 Tax=Rhodoplanes tepidamans TaxID=200616 RepID=A0ABT5J772_RHOTP|nr:MULTISPECIES: MgtC/SapB family protein [Rhodoplanes]MDC7785474.1 MgtC/SapB family protein [Rhodoplanes tepidamans]MDC7987321.1 MgtC/SapB family protein [Rhodoplanes sp. TEM]MDQ0353356.1 putative Mg2+ transporter-C (MgtC) family protein [Rhodoplanes tepidamans]